MLPWRFGSKDFLTTKKNTTQTKGNLGSKIFLSHFVGTLMKQTGSLGARKILNKNGKNLELNISW